MGLDPVLLARIQFAMTVGFHFIFPPISIGLAWLLVGVEWKAWRSGDKAWESMGRFFGKLLAITFAVGVATGITMEFQFGTNWAEYSKFVGDIFGAPLAAEAIFSFFLESTFLGLYLFGRNRVSKGLHWFSILMVAVGATLSAFWILMANSWQQTPAGYVFNEATGRAELTDFWAAVFNPSTVIRFLHVMDAALITGCFFMAGIAACTLLRNRANPVARKALRMAVIAALVVSVLELFPFGDHHARQVAETQPEKLAAFEGLYHGGTRVPITVFGIPTKRGLVGAIQIPGLLSLLVGGDVNAYVRGIDEFPPADRPPQFLPFVGFHLMVGLGMLFIGMSALGVLLLILGRLYDIKLFLWGLVLMIPLPVIACQLGWIAAEVGRQPWIVYHVMRTADAASVSVSAGEILFSLIMFGVIYLLLGALYVYLVAREAWRGPEVEAVA